MDMEQALFSSRSISCDERNFPYSWFSFHKWDKVLGK